MLSVGSDWFDNEVKPYYSFIQAHENSIETICFNPTNPLELASGSHDKLIKLWDIQKYKQTQKLSGHTAGVWATSFSVDGKLLISGSPDKTILVWDIKKGKPISQLKEHKNKIYWIKSSDDGKYFVSGGEGGIVIVWDMRKMALIKVIQASKDIVYNTDFLPGNKFLVTSDSAGQIKIFDSVQYELKAQTPAKGQKAYCLDSAPQLVDGKVKILAGYQNKLLRQWLFDPAKGAITMESESIAHMDNVTAVAANQANFATGARDGSARIWNYQLNKNGKLAPVATLVDHLQKITQIAFQPSKQVSNVVATCSWDQKINLYKI